jgi:hypothetical protein
MNFEFQLFVFLEILDAYFRDHGTSFMAYYTHMVCIESGAKKNPGVWCYPKARAWEGFLVIFSILPVCLSK